MTEHIAQGAFTYVTRGIASVLITPVFIWAAYDPQEEGESTFREYSAIWDTGATKTMITQHVAEDCGLMPTAQSRVRGVFGAKTVNGYLVNVALPTQHSNRPQENVAIHNLSVLEAPALTGGPQRTDRYGCYRQRRFCDQQLPGAYYVHLPHTITGRYRLRATSAELITCKPPRPN